MFLEFLGPLFWDTFIDLFIFQRLLFFFNGNDVVSNRWIICWRMTERFDIHWVWRPPRNTGKWRFIGIPYRWSLFLGGGRDELDKHSHWDLLTRSSPDIPILQSPNWLNFEPIMLSLFRRESPVVLQRNKSRIKGYCGLGVFCSNIQRIRKWNDSSYWVLKAFLGLQNWMVIHV